MDELKPCPFCGEEAHYKEVVSRCETLYTVGCYDSGCMGFDTVCCKTTKDDAAKAWNRRANECDREELLSIVEEMESFDDPDCVKCPMNSDCGDVLLCADLWVSSFALRIRKALGVER